MSQIIPGLESVTDITAKTIEAIRCHKQMCTAIENIIDTCPDSTKVRLVNLYKSLNVDNAIEICGDNIDKISKFVKARDYITECMSKLEVDSKIFDELCNIREAVDLDNANEILILTIRQKRVYDMLVAIIKKEINDQKLPYSDILELMKYELRLTLANCIDLSREIEDFVDDARENIKHLKLYESCRYAIESTKKDSWLFVYYDYDTLYKYLRNLQTSKNIKWQTLILEKISDTRTAINILNFLYVIISIFLIIASYCFMSR